MPVRAVGIKQGCGVRIGPSGPRSRPFVWLRRRTVRETGIGESLRRSRVRGTIGGRPIDRVRRSAVRNRGTVSALKGGVCRRTLVPADPTGRRASSRRSRSASPDHEVFRLARESSALVNVPDLGASRRVAVPRGEFPPRRVPFRPQNARRSGVRTRREASGQRPQKPSISGVRTNRGAIR